ncbi:hypothetical protein SteCoe_11517 [Stentor coeruleus]|uniref:Uncharacterized protein n=1 Tax=Stentor coeruleus TaxID=5963 RepID=A0A1R2CCZ6_9CILI|nr:hypothetical protein SteCoe_11517 [Stentor coeruleus]
MCNLNILCKVTDGSCKCCVSKPTGIVKPVPIPLINPQEGVLIMSLFKIITQQNEMIKKISEDARLTAEKINTLSQNLGLKQCKTVECASEEVTNSEKLLKILCGEGALHDYSLELANELPKPAFKEKAFSMILQIVDNKGQKVVLPNVVGFTIMLFTTESPPKLMKINTSGDKIMRGTSEADGNSTVLFRKIVIKEVTSHFRNGCFFLVVAPKDCNSIKPLIVPNFVIKARKLMSDGSLKKKIKINEEIVSPEEISN